MRLGDRQLVAPGLLERRSADVLHHDVADRIAVLVGVFDEVEDLDDPRVRDLGEELPLGHRDRLRLGVTGMHQTLEHDGPLVDVVVEGQIHPAQAAVRDAALDLVLVGDHVAGHQLRQERIRAAAVRAPALGQRPAVGRRPADRLAAVPAEPFRLRDNGIGHQRGQRIDLAHPRDLHQAAAEPAGRRQRPRHRGHLVLAVRCRRCRPRRRRESSKCRPEHRLRRHRPHRRRRIARRASSTSPRELAGWVPGAFEFSLLSTSVRIPRYRRRGRRDRAPSTTCGTTCSTCRRGGCGPACR